LCPDAAIERRERSIAIDLDLCKGCGICARECPAESIGMVPEEGGDG
jgi:Pyruvate/2-oxoacid:ferredoxin oxidoreductase delta subunit